MPGRRPTSTPVAVGLLLAALAACGSDSTSTPAAQPPTDAATSPTEDVTTTAGPREIQAPAELPRGGRELFPRYRLVGYSGGPASAAFGRLGIGDLDERVAELEKRAQPYAAGGRQVQPVLELIATVANSSAGSDGMYRTRASDATVRRYLRAARRHKALLLLGIQPGRADVPPRGEGVREVAARTGRRPGAGSGVGRRQERGPGLDVRHGERPGAGRGRGVRRHRGDRAWTAAEGRRLPPGGPVGDHRRAGSHRASRRGAGEVRRRHRQPPAEARHMGQADGGPVRPPCTQVSRSSTSRTPAAATA